MEVLHNYRKEIDKIDSDIIRLLWKRFEVIKHIKDIKKENNILFFDNGRYLEVMDDRSKKAEELGVRSEFIKEIFNLIHKESLDFQLKD